MVAVYFFGKSVRLGAEHYPLAAVARSEATRQQIPGNGADAPVLADGNQFPLFFCADFLQTSF